MKFWRHNFLFEKLQNWDVIQVRVVRFFLAKTTNLVEKSVIALRETFMILHQQIGQVFTL